MIPGGRDFSRFSLFKFNFKRRKGSKYERQIVINFFLLIYYYHHYMFLFQHRVYETAAVSTVDAIRSQIIGIKIRKVISKRTEKRQGVIII